MLSNTQQKILQKAGMQTPISEKDDDDGTPKMNLKFDTNAPPSTKDMVAKSAAKINKASATVTQPIDQPDHFNQNVPSTISSNFGADIIDSASNQEKPATALSKLNLTQINKHNFAQVEQIYKAMRSTLVNAYSNFKLNPLSIIEWDSKGKPMFEDKNIMYFIAEKIHSLVDLDITCDEARTKFEGFDLTLLPDQGDKSMKLSSMQQTAIIDQIPPLIVSFLEADGDLSDIVDYVLGIPDFKEQGMQRLRQSFTSAQAIMREIFDTEDANSVTAVRLMHSMYNSWSMNDDSPISRLGLNGGYLGGMQQIISSSSLISIMTPNMIRDRWKYISENYSYDLFGGDLSDFVSLIHGHLHEFAMLVEKSDQVAVSNKQHPSSLFLNDHTGVNAIFMLLGSDFVYGLNQVDWNVAYKKMWTTYGTTGERGASTHYSRRYFGLCSEILLFEQQHPNATPNKIRDLLLPCDFTSKVLNDVGSPSNDNNTQLPQASQASRDGRKNGGNRTCFYCGSTAQECGEFKRSTCIRMWWDCMHNSLDFMTQHSGEKLLASIGQDKMVNPPRHTNFDADWRKLQDPEMSKPKPLQNHRKHTIPSTNLGNWVNKPSTAERRSRLCGKQYKKPAAQQAAVTQPAPAPVPPAAPPPPPPAPPPAPAAPTVQGNMASVSALNTRVDSLEGDVKAMLGALTSHIKKSDEQHEAMMKALEDS